MVQDNQRYFEKYKFIGLDYTGLGDKEKAKENFNKYLELAPANYEGRKMIEELLNKVQ